MSGYADRVQETCNNPGTGTATLLGAVTGWQAVGSAFANGSVVYYTFFDGTNWEVGSGRYLSGADQLTRDAVLSSSNAGALVNFTGTTNVWCDFPAEVIIDMGTALSARMLNIPV